MHFDPNGRRLSDEEWARRKHEWLPAPKDREYLLSIMAQPVYEPGKFANYIAPPLRGIKGSRSTSSTSGRRRSVARVRRELAGLKACATYGLWDRMLTAVAQAFRPA